MTLRLTILGLILAVMMMSVLGADLDIVKRAECDMCADYENPICTNCASMYVYSTLLHVNFPMFYFKPQYLSLKLHLHEVFNGLIHTSMFQVHLW